MRTESNGIGHGYRQKNVYPIVNNLILEKLLKGMLSLLIPDAFPDTEND